jgi:hypothetical protein
LACFTCARGTAFVVVARPAHHRLLGPSLAIRM